MSRGNACAEVFRSASEFDAFAALVAETCKRIPMRILAYALMHTHFHVVAWPFNDGDLGRWMQWLLTVHVRRRHRAEGTSGRIWQGRYKTFPVQTDGHLLTVLRYVEANPLRAGLVERAEDWRWSSGWARERPLANAWLAEWPVERPAFWRDFVNLPQTAAELDALRRCARREAPFGDARWVEDTAQRLGLESTLRHQGRPRRPSTVGRPRRGVGSASID